jgi:hypothetical protein
MTHIARREFLSSLLFASVQSIVPASRQGASGWESSSPALHEHDFEAVRHKIVERIESGAATGVAVAVAHKGKHRLGGGIWMGESRGSHKGDLSYAVQPGIAHETLHHDDAHDPGC